MNKAFTYPFDAEYIISNKRRLKKELLSDGSERTKKKIAVLGGSTTGTLIPVLELFLLSCGIEPEFLESDFGKFREDAVFGNVKLDSFEPDFIYIHTCLRNITSLPELSDTKEQAEQKLEHQFGLFREIWSSLKSRFGCVIIQNNFELPSYRLLGNRDAVDFHGKVNFINRLNIKFADYAASADGFHINDINYLSSVFGLDRWNVPSDWYLYKLSPSTGAIPLLCHSVSSIIKAVCGKNKKAVALDLDNTLWGGTVGDVGQAGIEIGQESAQGQAFYDFQKYLKELSKAGEVLTVCSKNDEGNALDGLNHPEGVLRPSDFALIKANWDRKDINLINTANTLGLLPESFVFIDDNPAERLIVSENIKGIAVPEADDPSGYIGLIDRGGYFECVGLSNEDLKRSEMYRENAERAKAEHSFSDYGQYLDSLEMTAEIGDFPTVYIKRIAQLINKSNQFNLTTLRLSEDEVSQIADSDNYLRLCGKLTDRFGDNGVVSVVIGKKEGSVLDIILWLMSCRVLRRDMEFAMLNSLVLASREAGISKIRGKYIPSAKNSMVKELYGSFGFKKVSEDSGETSIWELDTDSFIPKPLHIKIKSFF